MDLILHIILLSFRLSNAILCKTSFDPDEYWQALEVAHRRTYGYGYLTWEWHTQLRSYLFPYVFECLYRVISFFGEFEYSRLLLILCPRLLMAVLAYMTDVYTFKICHILFGRMTAVICLYLQITSWFIFYAITRTFINSFETFLVVIIFYLFCQLMVGNYSIRDTGLRLAMLLTLIGLVCYLRPTAVPCISLYFIVLYFSSLSVSYKLILSIVVTLILSSILISTESLLYGKLAIPFYNFLNVNVVSGIASLYGTHSLHWYLTQCLPVFLITNIPAFIIGIIFVIKGSHPVGNEHIIIKLALLGLILLNLVLLSPVPHKEFRFLLPMLPFCHILTAKGIYVIDNNTRKHRLISLFKKLLLFLSLLQIPMSFYFGFIHQRGVIRVMDYLYGHISVEDQVLFLMPCHSTPLYSHIHKNATLQFLECSPPLYEPVDRAKLFYNNVNSQTDSLLSNGYSYVTCFSTLSEEINGLLAKKGFQKKAEIFHTHLPEGRIGSYVHVYKKIG
ncbi:hypothetical protein LOD99_4690 [Oopsacas minuta]|uniref:Mannosyltransferase n=1 Tax=Oopsacas minuta TaxID=111878 RepID=A0AAV7JUS5_9METZ|nr:hypothetical protein LOD99_4690 [Oopsacas minuta]